MSDTPPRVDLDELRAALVDRLEILADILMGERNAALSTRSRWRWGGKGSFALEMSGRKRGAWHSYEANEGGGPIQLIHYARGGTFAEAVEWGANWTGLSAATDADRAAYGAGDAKRKAKREQRRQADDAADEADRMRAIAYARRLAAEAVAIDGTPGETYLTATRAIPRPPSTRWPEAMRWHPGTRALLLVATDAGGAVRAVQRVFLDAQGRKVDAAELAARGVKAGKQTNGAVHGAAVQLPGPGGNPLMIAEGPETGLSVWRATGAETLVALGSLSNITPPTGRRVVLCRDDDRPNSPADKALAARVDQWRAAGVDLVVAQPWPERRGDKSDLNDALKAGGLAAVRARIEAALMTPGPAPQSCGDAGTVQRVTLAEGRAIQRKAVTGFFAEARAWGDKQAAGDTAKDADPPVAEAEDQYGAPDWTEIEEAAPAEDSPPVHIIKIDTGAGKTAEALHGATTMVVQLRKTGDRRNIVIATPTHNLSAELMGRFAAQPEAQENGLIAQIWRGRQAEDPDSPGNLMCRNFRAFREVQALHLDAEKQVCGICPYGPNGAGNCSYLAQRNLHGDVWFVSHNMMFEAAPKAFGRLAVLVVDESPLSAVLEGVERDRDRPKERSAITLDLSVLARTDHTDNKNATNRLMLLRRRALDAMAAISDGALVRDAFLSRDLTAASARQAIAFERRTLIKVKLTATMTAAERSTALAGATRNGDLGCRVTFWKALAALLAEGGPQFSGWARLVTDKEGGAAPVRFLELKGRREVGKDFRVPTLVLDATGRPELLRYIWPNLRQTADVRLLTPHLKVRQTTAADQALSRLDVDSAKDDAERRHRIRNLRDLHAIICREARRYAPGDVLVVAQKRIREALEALGYLPGNVELAHHNSLRGIDRFGNAAALIVIGRTLPTSTAVRAATEALTGVGQEALTYERGNAIRELPGGRVIPATWWRYPDRIGEALRWQACEAEVVQIVGRLRGANRTAANPADVLLLTDLPVPLPVEPIDMADLAPGPAHLMLAAAGIAFANPTDAATANPALWGNREAAKKAFQRARWGHSCIGGTLYTGMSPSGPLWRVDYQRAGARFSPTSALFDPAIIPDIEAELTRLLGPLASCCVALSPDRHTAEETGMPAENQLAESGGPAELADPSLTYASGCMMPPITDAWTQPGSAVSALRPCRPSSLRMGVLAP